VGTLRRKARSSPPAVPPVMTPAPPPSGDRLVRLRIMLLALSISFWAVVVVARLVHLQVMGRESFARQAARQSERTIRLDPRRGPILDRNGSPLAVSVDADSIYADPQQIDDPDKTASALALALGLGPGGRKALLAQLQRDRAFVWVKRKADPSRARAVRELDLDGIGFLTENRRYYPKRELASHVLGYVGLDNTGMSGIEYAFEKDIGGQGQTVVVRTDARRRPVEHTEKPSTEGHTVVLTIDESIQYVAETELARAVSETGSIAGFVVVLEPRTGEILAIANRPTFNPNRFEAYGSARWRNRAAVDAYEPGSMLKMITAAAALQEKVVDPDEVLDCGNGFINIAGERINDHKAFDHLPFRDVIAFSSDVGMVRVAQRLGRELLDRYLRDFGFGSATGVELPGESSGILRPTSRWSARSLASISFGQEIGVTGLQMAAATAAIANGGYLMKPLIVRRIEDSEGRPVKVFKPVAMRRVLEPETVDLLVDLLRGVVRYGTGKRAAIAGYTVAGKTGTAQKVDASGRYSMVDHVASFVGFVPVTRPALVVLVSLDTPKGWRNEGGDVAAPVFARVAAQALRRLAVPPEDPDRVLRATAYRPESVLRAAYRPAPEPVPALPDPGLAGEPHLMLDLRGQSARRAAIAAARWGLVVRLEGSGRVVAQRPAAGSEIEPGMTCVLTLEPPAAAKAAPVAAPAPPTAPDPAAEGP
jgi:cell division protein FtsI (penicillin-binding protein 3)